MSVYGFPEAAAHLDSRSRVARIADAVARQRLLATGTISATATISFGSGSACRCTLVDGTGEVDLLFVGRPRIAGMVAGTRCRVEGTVMADGARLVIWNPLYCLEPGAALHPTAPHEQLALADAHREPASGEERAPRSSAGPAAAARRPPDVAAMPGSTDIATAVDAAGHFRIYLGAAPGVGKTMAMLDEGHRRSQRGADVVIGIVETHQRPMTEARTAGLEVVPRRPVAYRATTLEEMDLAALLARHPKVALVDELAHTNVHGTVGHEKRWQDVMTLLEAEIDVITTVNIQHLESIADAVEQITGVPVRERVPDWVVRRANQIELVDSSPEQLRRRMLHGNIYPTDKVAQALTHFFRVDTLTALRELALRFLADETEEDLLAHLERYKPQGVWETTERIMIGVSAVAGTDALVRRASRMATRVRAELHAVHVISQEVAAGTDEARLSELRRLVSDVDAQWHELRADHTVDALVEFACRHQITQIVLGSSQRTRWQQLTGGGSTVRRITRLATANGIDVHIIARHDEPAR
ncbi:MAG: universal stress protein [Acidimicrobiales bacterium]